MADNMGQDNENLNLIIYSALFRYSVCDDPNAEYKLWQPN